jgi:TPR repeat protein
MTFPHTALRTFAIHSCLTFLFFLSGCHPMKAYSEPFTALSDLALLSEEGVLPRNINLKTFEPHREAFICEHAARRAPVWSAEAQERFEEGMSLTSPALWPNERNWPRAMKLWDEAARLGHWKAAIMWIQTAQTGQGEDSEKGRFAVAAQDPEEVVQRVEVLMRQNVAEGFYLMGVFHDTGYGVKFSVDRAWAFWELAADMGSARAQTRIAKSLGFVDRAQEKPGVAEWANETVQFLMLECAYSQGHGEGGFRLGMLLDLLAEGGRAINDDSKAQFARARQILHDAVKFGSEDAAGYLSSSYRSNDPLVRPYMDIARADRYHVLAHALWDNPDLRFPNLDKVLPLPPALLPQWDGNPDTLIDAAKGVRVAPQPVTTSVHRLPPQDRAHIPPGHTLQVPAHLSSFARRSLAGFTTALEDNTRPPGMARAPVAGYWQPRVLPAHAYDDAYTTHLRRELADLPPMRFREHERLQIALRGTTLAYEDAVHRLVRWHFMGMAVPQVLPKDWLAQAGTVRAIAAATRTTCASGQPCPHSGIWQPYALDASHPMARVLSTATLNEAWKRQAFVPQGERMPRLGAQGLPVEDDQVGWWLIQACEMGFGTPITT